MRNMSPDFFSFFTIQSEKCFSLFGLFFFFNSLVSFAFSEHILQSQSWNFTISYKLEKLDLANVTRHFNTHIWSVFQVGQSGFFFPASLLINFHFPHCIFFPPPFIFFIHLCWFLFPVFFSFPLFASFSPVAYQPPLLFLFPKELLDKLSFFSTGLFSSSLSPRGSRFFF